MIAGKEEYQIVYDNVDRESGPDYVMHMRLYLASGLPITAVKLDCR